MGVVVGFFFQVKEIILSLYKKCKFDSFISSKSKSKSFILLKKNEKKNNKIK